jgi:hypothetical protein
MAKVWTAEEEKFLMEHYDDITNAELAVKYQVTPKAVSHKMRRLRDRIRREHLKRNKELDELRKLQRKEEQTAEIFFEEQCEPLNLPKIEAFEKSIYIDGSPMSLISTGFFVKTELGWAQIMMQKRKLAKTETR